MPPRDNKVAAADLTSDGACPAQALIDQGAKGEVRSEGPIVWQPLPESYNPIYTVALTQDGQFAACNRANRICVYHLSVGDEPSWLSDPLQPAGLQAGTAPVAHRDAVHSLAFDPDGTLLASGGYREIKLWRREKAVPVSRSLAPSTPLTAAALHPRGDWVATADERGRLQMARLADGTVMAQANEHGGAIRFLQFSPEGTRLLTYGQDAHAVQIWEVPALRLVTATNLHVDVNAITWLNPTNHLAVATDKGRVVIWSVPEHNDQAWSECQQLTIGQAELSALAAVPGDPDQLITGGVDGMVRLWQLHRNVQVRAMKQAAPIVSIAVSLDGKRVAAAGTDNQVQLWAVDTGQSLARLRGDRYALERLSQAERLMRRATNDLRFSKAAFESAEKERKSQLERVRKAENALTSSEASAVEKQKKLDEAVKLKANAEARFEKMKSDLDHAKSAWNTQQQAAQETMLQLKSCLGMAPTNGAATQPAALAVAQVAAGVLEELMQAAATLAQAAGEAKVRLEQAESEFNAHQKQAQEDVTAAKKRVQDAETEVKKASLDQSNGENELVLAIASAQKGADAASEAQNSITLAEAERKKADWQLEAARRASHESEVPIRSVAFADGLLLTAGAGGALHTWNARTGQAVDVYRGPSAPVLALGSQPSGRVVSVAADGHMSTWDVRPNWALQARIGSGEADSPISDRVNALAFSPDGKTLPPGAVSRAVAGKFSSGTSPLESSCTKLPHHPQRRRPGSLFPFGQIPGLGGGGPLYARHGPSKRNKCRALFEGHTHHVLGVAWNDDGRTLATACADNVAVVERPNWRTEGTLKDSARRSRRSPPSAPDGFLATSGEHQPGP
ncbi:MAG: hypothetical protein U1G07_03830 [Verrucomicrobiota bacterium]